jgi:hypothetical protein
MKTFQHVTNIKQTSRSQARETLKQLKYCGKDAKLIDNGSHLQGVDRWRVQIVAVKLAATRKPIGDLFCKFKQSTALKARTASNWHKDQVSKQVLVFTKKKHSYDINCVN